MIRKYLIYISLLFIVFEVYSKPAFISQDDSYELDFSSGEVDISVNTNSKFNLSLKMSLGFISKALKMKLLLS